MFVHCIVVCFLEWCNTFFWPRAMLKSPKRSFVFVLVLGVKTWVRNVQGNKKCAREQKRCFCGTLWYWITVFALSRWLKLGLVNRTGARSWDLYFLKVLALGIREFTDFYPSETLDQNQFLEVILLHKVKIFNNKSKNFLK